MYIDIQYTNSIIDLIAKYVALRNYGRYSTQQFKFCSDKNQPVPSLVGAFELLDDFDSQDLEAGLQLYGPLSKGALCFSCNRMTYKMISCIYYTVLKYSI